VNRSNAKSIRILGIAPSTRGFGFAVFEGEALVNWGVKSVKGDKNTQCLLKIEEMLAHYLPTVMVLENHSATGSKRSPRIRALGEQLIAMARSRKVKLALFSRQQVRKTFFPDGKGTKDALAEILAQRFPEELALRLPATRRPWMSEAYQMGIFDAVALTQVFLHRSMS